MKKKKRILLIVVIATILVSGIGFALYKALIDENSLSINEKKWLDQNSNNVIQISIPNDIPVFGSTGEGVFFDYIEYLNKKTNLDISKNMVSYHSAPTGYHFEINDVYDRDGLLLYKDHFVLVSKNNGSFTDDSILSLKPGIVNSTSEMVTKYYNTNTDSFNLYESYAKITEDLGNGNLQYALVPLNEYKDEIIADNINILFHVSDLNKYYYYKLGEDPMLNSIMKKTFSSFKDSLFEKSFNENNYKLFINNLKITEAEEDSLTNEVYHYGFVENRPYEILTGGNYGGITADYLRIFEEFSGVEFTYKKYKTTAELAEAAIDNKIDLYYNYYDLITNFVDCGSLKNITYYVIAHNKIDLSLSNINGLAYRDVYVQKDSYLFDLLEDLDNVNIITYSNTNELEKILNKESIILVDNYTYNYYINKLSNNYTVRLRNSLDGETYSFRYKTDTDTFYKLFNAYTKTLDPNDVIRTGMVSYNKVDQDSKFVGTVAKYILIIVFGSFLAILFIRKKSKNVKLNTKVKKEDRLKYIDLLTSLKNRNYYNEKIHVWNKNTIYPQTVIVMDINRVKELNDSYGHEEGDKQIQAVANILIKTQIDNSEIIRTDGNEFFVYLIGYSEKQILTYMKKLVKEFKKLPYDSGVAMGFSMILDDTKLIEDAFNEASIQMRDNKESDEEKNDKKI